MLRKIFNSRKKCITGKPITSEENNPNLAKEKIELNNKTVNQKLSQIINISEVKIINKPQQETSIIEETIDETNQSNAHKINNELIALCNIAESHKKSTNWHSSYNIIVDAKNNWEKYEVEEIDEELKLRFDDAYNHFLKRYDAHKVVKESINNREIICEKIELFIKNPDITSVNSLEEIILSWNHLTEIPARYDEILTKKFQTLCENFEVSKKELDNQIHIKNQIKPTLEALCSKIEELAKSEETYNIAKNLEKLIAEWNSFTNELSDIEEYRQRFENAKKIINPKLEKIEEEQQKLSSEIISFCNKIKEYSELKQLKSVLSDVKELQTAWDNLEETKVKKQYSDKYKKYYRIYFTRLKYIQQKEDWGRWENYTKKTLLCEKIEKLMDESDLHKVSRDIKSIWSDWRKIGSVPKEKNEMVWDKFNSKRQILISKCKDFYKELDKSRQINYELKVKLCIQAEELENSTDLEPTSAKLKSIQEEWKKIGRAPQPHNDELFTRLRKSCNLFFENRIKFYDGLHSIQSNNKEIKKNICEEAKNLHNLPRDKALKRIKEMHSIWKKTGPASRKDEQKLWEYFNTELDNFFNTLENEKPLNLEKKNALCLELEKSLNENHSNSVEELNNLKEKINNIKDLWKSIGPVPKKDETLLNKQFNEKLNNLLEKYHNLQQTIKHQAIDEFYTKEILFEEIEFLANTIASTDSINEQLKLIEKKWADTQCKTLSESNINTLEEKFQKECTELKNNNTAYFKNLVSIKSDNLETKKRILVDLEKLANINVTNDINKSLEDELKLAIESNFASEEKKTSPDDCLKHYNTLVAKWDIMDSIPLNEYKSIYDRFNNACIKLNSTLKKDI
jgi:hypothetical protein